MILLINIIKIVFLLGFLVLIHESGHFFVAKLCKVRVNEFSIGFGPTILKKQGKVTKYSLRLIPLGGYVSLEGEETHSNEEGSYSNASILKRMAIIVAGGIVNIIFGIIVYFILICSSGNNISLVVENPIEGSMAEQVGIKANDEIIKINNKRVRIKSDIDKILKESNGEELLIELKEEGKEKQIKLTPIKEEYKNTGIYLKSLSSGESTKILTVQANSVAEKNGIEPNDEILKINGIEVKNQQEIIQEMNKTENETINITLKRNNKEINVEIEPEILYNYYIGVYFKKADNNFTNNIYYSFFETKEFALSIVDNLKQMVKGNVRANQLMGPVGISEVVAKTNGIKDYIYMLALISLSLGVTNLLPIPALDGGKFLLLIIEAIRRKKISEKTEINIQLLGFSILIILSIYITYNDILRIL